LGSGIGLETACLFATEGAQLVLADINEAALDTALTRVRALVSNPATIIICKCDVSKETDVKACVDLAVSQFGGLDVMFNNAGIMHPKDDDAINTDEAVWYFSGEWSSGVGT
jgi:NAD(P)-dependent dehydrogenase (short-subunit alcohol dehydrogenase family)